MFGGVGRGCFVSNDRGFTPGTEAVGETAGNVEHIAFSGGKLD